MNKPDIMDCPGAWYGWQPKVGECGEQGHVIVDPEKIQAALAWLGRRFWVGATKLTEDKGVSIQLALRIKRRAEWLPHQSVTVGNPGCANCGVNYRVKGETLCIVCKQEGRGA